MRFVFFRFHLSKVLRLPRKSEASSYEVLHLSRKIVLANLKIWCSKMQPLAGYQRPDPRTSLMNMSLVLRPLRKMHLCRPSSNVPRLPAFLTLEQNPHVFLIFDKVHNSLAPWNDIWTSKKTGPNMLFFNMLISKRASRHNGVHFFDISTSKSAPRMVCFVHFDFEMCFAPQRFLISHLDKWLRTCRFSEPTFRPSGATNHWKNTVICDFSTFSRNCIFCLLTLSLFCSSFFFSCLLSFHLSILSEDVGSLTSKLPSIIGYHIIRSGMIWYAMLWCTRKKSWKIALSLGTCQLPLPGTVATSLPVLGEFLGAFFPRAAGRPDWHSFAQWCSVQVAKTR